MKSCNKPETKNKFKHMRFLIVVPRFVSKIGQHYTFPLGLAYISASLKSKGYSVECLNLNHCDGTIKTILKNKFRNNYFNVLCTGGLSIHYTQIKNILSSTRDIAPSVLTVIGGGLLSSNPKLIMSSLKSDFGIFGEGEETIIELAREMSLSQNYSSINGITYFDVTKKLIITPPRPAIKDLDELPMPDYDGFGIDMFLDMQTPNDDHYMYHFDDPRALPVIASRSCPYNCTFCYHPLGKQYRQRSLDSLFKELDYIIKKYNVNILTIYDELFSADKKRIRKFCERIKPYGIKFLISMRVDGVDPETLSILKNAGCFLVGYGLESASPTIIKSMKKHISLKQIKTALDLTYESKLAMQGNFIFSDRSETLSTAEETIKFWLNYRKHQINLTALYLYPGTELYAYANSKGIIENPIQYLEHSCPPKNITQMTDMQYSELLGKIYKLRIENPVPAKVLRCNKSGENPVNGNVFNISITCPHCHETIDYDNLHQNGNSLFILGHRLGCKFCNQRFDILPFNFYIELLLNKKPPPRQIRDIFPKHKTVAIYGAGRGGGVLYDYCKNIGKSILYFIDDYKTGKYCGLDIYSPDQMETRLLPDLTIFAGISLNFSKEVKTKMKNWKKTETLLFTRTDSFRENTPMTMYYINYYHNIWVPLLNNGI